MNLSGGSLGPPAYCHTASRDGSLTPLPALPSPYQRDGRIALMIERLPAKVYPYCSEPCRLCWGSCEGEEGQ